MSARSSARNNANSCAPCETNRPSERHSLQKLELQPGLRVNHRCAGGMSIVRLSRCLWRACRLDAARLYRDPTSIHINRGEFHSERPGFARISARGRDLSECFGSTSQYDVSLNRNILRDFRLEASAYHTLRSDKANRRYCHRCSSGNRSGVQRRRRNASAGYSDNCNQFFSDYIGLNG